MSAEDGRLLAEIVALSDEDGYPLDEAIVLAAESFGITPVEAAHIWDWRS